MAYFFVTKASGSPTAPGADLEVETLEELLAFIEEHGACIIYPPEESAIKGGWSITIYDSNVE